MQYRFSNEDVWAENPTLNVAVAILLYSCTLFLTSTLLKLLSLLRTCFLYSTTLFSLLRTLTSLVPCVSRLAQFFFRRLQSDEGTISNARNDPQIILV
mmetsp:Transcript_33227/g.79372  ORF Transcript_33227/g.79372 Transcript_33227/m.79372 type:complete len:98 (+) Transcript_33227:1081-1374(+)